MSLETATLLFLVVAFVSAELYRIRRGRRGIILGADDAGLRHLLLPVVTVKVRLQGGEEIEAELNCCTACLGRLQVGDEVRVLSSRNGYVIDLPWRRSARCEGATPATCGADSDGIRLASSSR